MDNKNRYSDALKQLTDAHLVSLFSLGSTAEAALRRLIENNLKKQPTDFLITISYEFDLLKLHTLHQVPTISGMYLKLTHGRATVDEEMNDWGEDGPWIGPIEWFHCTYLTDIGIGFTSGEELTFMRPSDDYPSPMYLYEEMLYFDGVYYGDWELQYIGATAK